MTSITDAFLLLVGLPLLGAGVGLAVRHNTEALKGWLLLVAFGTIGTAAWMAVSGAPELPAWPLVVLLPLAAFVSLLGQPLHRSHCAPWLFTLPLLALALGSVTAPPPLSWSLFLLLVMLLGVLLFHYRHLGDVDARWGIGTAAISALALIGVMTLAPPVAAIALIIACATALPLMPFHSAYVAALTGLPGNLPAFLAVLLPVVGFQQLFGVLPQIPEWALHVVSVLALIGMAFGSLKCFTKSRVASVVAYGGSAFFSILWWHLSTGRGAPASATIYMSAVALATSGLLLAWHVLRARYGEIAFRALSGLAEPMPRFAVLLSLVALAALGFPPFGVFAGFVGMVLAPSFSWSPAVFVIILAWLSASWYLFDVAQSVLFGRRQPGRRYEDVRTHEFLSLTIVVVLLIALGVMPSRLFEVGRADTPRTFVSEVPAGKK